MNVRNGVRLTIVFSVIHIMSLAQVSFENYVPLQAKGKQPEFFTQSIDERIKVAMEKDRPSLSEEEEMHFLEGIHYDMEEMINSGLILYGDEATKYVEKVADKLMESKPKLKRQLQFYTLRSNVTNALSTDQGIIFVTMGLLAQLENEAQLAYILSHEIAHFEAGHVEKSYKERKDVGKDNMDRRIILLSNHSKDQELEADRKGIDLYNKAGYKKSELLSAFDVLMYSYLPFDEEVFDHSYYQTDLAYIPDEYYPATINPIRADEDYDDSKSSHPNIRKRREEIYDAIADFTNWGDKEFLFPKEEFDHIRTIARFETVHEELIECDYTNALYSIYLLEKEYPNNLFLMRSKAHAWYGLVQFKMRGRFSRTTEKPEDVEGESHAIHYLMRNFSKLELMVMAMRTIEDAHKLFPDDKEIKLIRDYMIRQLASTSRFKLSEFKTKTYQEALKEFEESKQALLADTLEEQDDNDEELSKYDKIRQSRESNKARSEDDEFDTEQFIYYALSDLVENDDFVKTYREHKESLKLEEEEEMMSGKKPRNSPDVGKELLFMQPYIIANYYDEYVPKESYEKEQELRTYLFEIADKEEFSIIDLSRLDASMRTTQGYNERMLLLNNLRQSYRKGDIEMLPVDYSFYADFKKNYDNKKVLLTYATYDYTRATFRTSLSAYILAPTTNEVWHLKDYNSNVPFRKALMKSFARDIFDSLKEL